MSKSRKSLLDDNQKRDIVAILSVGCCRATAARYVGCTPNTIFKVARCDPSFAEQVRHAESRAEVGYMTNIQKAARQERYWRAAAWALERRNPTDYGPRPTGAFTHAQVEILFEHVADIVAEILPDSEHRHVVLKRLDALVREFLGPEALQVELDALEDPAE